MFSSNSLSLIFATALTFFSSKSKFFVNFKWLVYIPKILDLPEKYVKEQFAPPYFAKALTFFSLKLKLFQLFD
jgi:hypothetical protein